MSDLLGRRMHFQAFALRGRLENERWRVVLADATAAIDMANAGDAAEWVYPLANGAGGQGATIVQPITESFLALDTWPDHDGAYLIVCSCRPFDARALDHVLKAHGLVVTGTANHRLEIHQ
jgi:S-adenosylmethionine/arginine decarboxylase-like enzyme